LRPFCSHFVAGAQPEFAEACEVAFVELTEIGGPSTVIKGAIIKTDYLTYFFFDLLESNEIVEGLVVLKFTVAVEIPEFKGSRVDEAIVVVELAVAVEEAGSVFAFVNPAAS
jgi:hypothetical protein